MLILRHAEVREILDGREPDVVDAVRTAYELHHQSRSALPFSAFLRLPATAAAGGPAANRIIGLPAYLGGDVDLAGIKWVSSFPGNVEHGIERASAVMVLNSMLTGRPEALIEASLVSAARTAASAALAAAVLLPAGAPSPTRVVVIGCGPINATVLRYLATVFSDLREAVLYDLSVDRSTDFAVRYGPRLPGMTLRVVRRAEAAAGEQLVTIATTASRPHLDLPSVDPGATVLHVSLRDLTVPTVLAHHNVTDDVDHVCREQTSLHLAAQRTGDRAFDDATLGEVLVEGGAFRRDPGKAVLFSPFGLGVLDLAVAKLVVAEAVANGAGTRLLDFLPGA